MNRRIANAVAIALVAALAVVPAAVAGKGHSGQGNTPADPSLAASCNPCALGSFAHFSGSGYDPAQPRALVYFRSSDGSTTQTEVGVSSDGTIAFDIYMAPAGTYDVFVAQELHNKTVLQAQLNRLAVQ